MAVVSKTSMQRSPKTGRNSTILYIVLGFVAGAVCMLIVTPECSSPSPILSTSSATEQQQAQSINLRSVETPTEEVAAVVTEEEEEPKPKKGPTLEFPPGTKSITLNIGTNSDPILPLKSAGPCSKVLAFEPIVPETIPKHPQLMVIPAAVSNENSLSTMHVYNVGGVSSSLGKVNKDGAWNSNENRGEPKVVPVVTMKDVIAAIPKDIVIDMIDTDMQGFDFTAVSSAIEEIKARGVKYLKTEVHMNNVNYGYQGAKNDLCEQWMYVYVVKSTFNLLTALKCQLCSTTHTRLTISFSSFLAP